MAPKYSLTRREKLHSWFLGWRDAKKYVDPKVDENLISSSVSSLVDQRFSKVMAINEDFHRQLSGFAERMKKVDELKRPPETYEISQAGREWHAYSRAKSDATSAAEQIVHLREAYWSRVQAHLYSADAIMNIYVSTLKRHHPRRDLLVDWFPALPAFSTELIFIHPSIEASVKKHLDERIS